MPMEIVRTVVVERTPTDVFDFVADACNDPLWCPKVISTRRRAGSGPGAGAVYDVVHKPVPGRPSRAMAMTCRSLMWPSQVEWHEDDGKDSVVVTYTLEDLDPSTRFTQRSLATLSTPGFLAPIMRHGIGRDIQHQLRRLKAVLEQDLSVQPRR